MHIFVSGFDNFLKRHQEGSQDEDADKNSNQEEKKGSSGKEETTNDEHSGDAKPKDSGDGDNDTKKWSGGGFGPFRSQHNYYSKNNSRNDNEGWNSGSGLPPNFSSTMLTAFLLLGLTYVMMRDDVESSAPPEFSSREITWNDFCKYLLETGQVEKIVVTNNRAVAKVFLKPGSQGLSQQQSRHFRYADRRQQGAAVKDPTFDDSTHIGEGSSGDGLGSSSLPHAKGHGHQHQIVYRFAM